MSRGRRDPLIDQTVLISRGNYKGYLGIVKEATETTARVELHTNCKIINVARDAVKEANSARQATGGEGFPRDYPTTPSAWTRTPMREDIPATPMRVATPMRSFGTPSHDPWNPAVPNTPARPETPARDGWEDSAWTPGTPGTARSDYSAGTPSGYSSYSPFSPAGNRQGGVYNPTTPGSTYGSFGTPGSSYTPSGYSERTPQDSSQSTPYASSPSTPLTPRTPGMPQTPATPSTPGVHEYEAGTPYDENAAGAGSSASNEGPWQEVGIEVTVSASFRGGAYASAKGVIKEVMLDQSCRVQFHDLSGEVAFVPNDAMEPVAPNKKERLRVVRGEHKGNNGTLIGVYGQDGIVKMEATQDIKILPMTMLAKLAA
jgi:transcription elongation factor SPT5